MMNFNLMPKKAKPVYKLILRLEENKNPSLYCRACRKPNPKYFFTLGEGSHQSTNGLCHPCAGPHMKQVIPAGA